MKPWFAPGLHEHVGSWQKRENHHFHELHLRGRVVIAFDQQCFSCWERRRESAASSGLENPSIGQG